jgi:hypothetical protein
MIKNLNKLAILLLFLTISVNNGYCQSNLKYKGFIEFGSGINFYNDNWKTTETSVPGRTFGDPNQMRLRPFLSFRSTNGVFIKNRCFFGISFGIEKMKGDILKGYSSKGRSMTTYFNVLTIPLGIDSKVYLSRGQFRPTIGINTGRAFTISKQKIGYTSFTGDYYLDVKTGNYFNPSIGFEILTSRRIKRVFIFNIGYKFQKINSTYTYINRGIPSGWSTISSNLNILSFNLGYSF